MDEEQKIQYRSSLLTGTLVLPDGATVNVQRLVLSGELTKELILKQVEQSLTMSALPDSPVLGMNDPPMEYELNDLVGCSKIDAIKKMRERRGLGLKEAKDLVELWEQQRYITYGSPGVIMRVSI